MLLTADHGNIEMMQDPDTHEPYTAHTTLDVPVLAFGAPTGAQLENGRLADVAPTMLALMGIGTGINYWLAWGYVGLRIIHSLIQCTVNIVRYRLMMFLLATLCLAGMTVNAGLQLLRDCGLI